MDVPDSGFYLRGREMVIYGGCMVLRGMKSAMEA